MYFDFVLGQLILNFLKSKSIRRLHIPFFLSLAQITLDWLDSARYKQVQSHLVSWIQVCWILTYIAFTRASIKYPILGKLLHFYVLSHYSLTRI